MKKKPFNIVHIIFILSILVLFWVISENEKEGIEFSNKTIDSFFSYSYIFLVPIYLIYFLFDFFRRNQKVNLLNVLLFFFTIVLIAFTLFIGVVSQIGQPCNFRSSKVIYQHKENNSNTILYRELCGYDIESNSLVGKCYSSKKHFIIFSKIEEIDTNTLDMSQWEKVKR